MAIKPSKTAKFTVFLTLNAIITGILLIPTFMIYKKVKTTCIHAKSLYSKDCVTSLIVFAQDEDNSFKSRNTAIWALGQLADKRAIKYLEFASEESSAQIPCDSSTSICKYEVQKALKWCQHGNITNWLYKSQDFQ